MKQIIGQHFPESKYKRERKSATGEDLRLRLSTDQSNPPNNAAFEAETIIATGLPIGVKPRGLRHSVYFVSAGNKISFGNLQMEGHTLQPTSFTACFTVVGASTVDSGTNFEGK